MRNIRYLVEEDLLKVENNLINLFKNDNDIFNDLGLFLSEKSKRIRSIITLLYLKINNALIDNNTISLLTAGELIHNASLLHDDVIDNSEYRRGNLTMFKKYNSKIAILSGDYLLSYVIDYLKKINNNDIFDIFINTTKNMCEAEVLQYINRKKTITIDEYLNIIYGKTASLFECILKSSAIIAKIDIEKASEFGKSFGLLFQINNDLSDDSIKNDKQNNIMTVLDILGIEKTNALKDNYKESLRANLKEYSKNQYKQALEDLIDLL